MLTSLLPKRLTSRGDGHSSKYNGFISYSHVADMEFAPSLQRGLRKLAKPWNRRNALRVFLDKTSLAASTDLNAGLDGPIAQSEYFILLASTKASSPESWVRKEVDYWIENKDMNRLLIAKTDGEISWDSTTNDFDWEKTTALPRSLAGAFKAEPNYVDFSTWQSEVRISEDPAFREAIARLAAPIHGKSMEDLFGEDLDQHRRTKRIVRVGVSMLAALLIVATALAVFAFQQRNIAEKAAQQAIKERNRALVALFQDLRLNAGDAQNAGSLCFEPGPHCVRGRKIAGVDSPPGTAIPLGVFGADTMSNINPTSNVFVVASQAGEGRVIGYGHDGLIRDVEVRNCGNPEEYEQCVQRITDVKRADNLRFVNNALRWAMRSTPSDCESKQVTVAIYEWYETMSNTQEIATLAQQRGWSYQAIDNNNDLGPQLRCVNAVIWGNPWNNVSDPQLAAIVAYVRSGGGLLLGGLGWSWIAFNNEELGIEEYPSNRLAASFGFSFTKDVLDVGVELRLEPPQE